MLILRMRRGPLPKLENPAAFLDELRKAMQPLIRPSRELIAENLGVDTDSLTWAGMGSGPLGFRRRRPAVTSTRKMASQWTEIFVSDSGFLVIALRRLSGPPRMLVGGKEITEPSGAERYVLEASAIMSSIDEADQALDIVSVAAKSSFNIEVDDYFYTSEDFDSIRNEVIAEDLPNSEADIRAARATASPEARALAIRIRSSRGLLVKDFGKLVEDGDASELVDDLITAGVAVRDVVVVCGVSQAQVARVPDRSSLDKLASEGIRCGCGRQITQESVEELLTITDLGGLLLDKSRWLSILIREELVTLGVRYEDILLECQLGGDEVDCIALIGGDLTIFELKDKEFSMGSAYSFSAKISAISPDHSVILTTDKVAESVKERFSRVRRDPRISDDRVSTIEYVEGEDFRSGLQLVVHGIYRPAAIRILDAALWDSVPEAASVLDSALSLNKPEPAPKKEQKSRKRNVAIRSSRQPSSPANVLEIEDDA
jgi:hypothetical protein